MTVHTHETSFWRSRTGIVLLVFIGLAAAFLATEHWAHLAGPLPLLLPLLICLAMHVFMHGSHGGHGHGSNKE